jgi:starch phosphorylase
MEAVKGYYYRYLRYFLAKENATATKFDKYMALCYAVRSMLVDGWIETQRKYHKYHIRRIYFISTEYLLGKQLRQNIINLGIENNLEKAARELGFSLEEIYEQENELALGNGREARFAASMQEAMASCNIPVTSYGLRYEYGQFQQHIQEHTQLEEPYDVLHKGHPWEIVRPEYSCMVTYPGQSQDPEDAIDDTSPHRGRERLYAVPYDIPMVGYRNGIVNNLRLWASREAEEFPFEYRNHQDYVRACQEINQSGKVCSILFPDENIHRATQQRLKQRYFLVSASLQDILRRFKTYNKDIRAIASQVVIHVNGIQCALAIPELMRLLMNNEGFSWEEAWQITRRIFIFSSYANEAKQSESWPEYLMKQVFPECLSVIYQINDYVRARSDNETYAAFPLIEDGLVRRIRMDTLAVLGSHAMNEPRTYLKQKTDAAYGGDANTESPRFYAIGHGVSHRQWLLTSNQPLAGMICELIGEEWIRDPAKLSGLSTYLQDEEILFKLNDIRFIAKQKLAKKLHTHTGIAVDPHALFDVQTTKIHVHKRQLLHLFHILDTYCGIKGNGHLPSQKRVHLFAGKAAHTDNLAKQIIMLIHLTAEMINNDPDVEDTIKVVFVPNYSMSWASHIIPASDVYEELSLPRHDQSPTTCLKYAFNGTLILGSRNRTLRHFAAASAQDTVFLFGNDTADTQNGGQTKEASRIIERSQKLQRIFTMLQSCFQDQVNAEQIKPLVASLKDEDNAYMLHDFEEYTATQQDISTLYGDSARWAQRSLRTIAGCSGFSMDTTMHEFATRLWEIDDDE